MENTNNLLSWIILIPFLLIGIVVAIYFIHAIFKTGFDSFSSAREFIFEYLHSKIGLPRFLAIPLSLVVGLLIGIIVVIVLGYFVLMNSGCVPERGGC